MWIHSLGAGSCVTEEMAARLRSEVGIDVAGTDSPCIFLDPSLTRFWGAEAPT